RRFLPFADMPAQRSGLLVGEPVGAGVAHHRENERVDPPIFLAGNEIAGEAKPAAPRPAPGRRAGFKLRDNPRSDNIVRGHRKSILSLGKGRVGFYYPLARPFFLGERTFLPPLGTSSYRDFSPCQVFCMMLNPDFQKFFSPTIGA